MTTSGEPIYSNLAIPPGEGLLEEIEFRGISPQELAATLGLSVDAMNEVITGDRAITPDIAASLETHFGHIRPALAKPRGQIPGYHRPKLGKDGRQERGMDRLVLWPPAPQVPARGCGRPRGSMIEPASPLRK